MDHILNVGPFKFNLLTRVVSQSDIKLEMSDSEFDLFYFLASHVDSIISRDEISRQLYGREFDGLDRTIDNKIMKIRKVIGDNIPYRHLITVRGRGTLLSIARKPNVVNTLWGKELNFHFDIFND